MLLVENPIDRGDEESTIRASIAELRRKREQEGDPFAEQKAPIIERAYLAHHGAKALREASHDLRQRHRLERNDAQFIQGLGISKAATLREATRAVRGRRAPKARANRAEPPHH